MPVSNSKSNPKYSEGVSQRFNNTVSKLRTNWIALSTAVTAFIQHDSFWTGVSILEGLHFLTESNGEPINSVLKKAKSILVRDVQHACKSIRMVFLPDQIVLVFNLIDMKVFCGFEYMLMYFFVAERIGSRNCNSCKALASK